MVYLIPNKKINLIFIICDLIAPIKSIPYFMTCIWQFKDTRSVNARFAHRIVGQSNFTCPFQIDQSQSLEMTISSPSLFCIGL